MKKLNQFVKFDFEAFSAGKVYRVVGISEWTDFESKAHLGTKVEAVIVEDKTPYKQKDGEDVNNAYEKITFKVKKDVKIPADTRVIPVNAVATVYGNYRNMLSVTADDIRVIIPKRPTA